MLNTAALIAAYAMSAETDLVFRNGFDQLHSCPANRVLVSDIFYPPNSSNVRRNALLETFEDIWGHMTPSDPAVPWPGLSGSSPVIKYVTRGGYVAALFHTPANLTSSQSGAYRNANNFRGPNIDFAISRDCGDFAPPDASCRATNFAASDEAVVTWRGGTSTAFFCGLAPDTDYFINVRFNDPNPTGPNCTDWANGCYVHISRQ